MRLSIRAKHVDMEPTVLREYVAGRLGFALHRFRTGVDHIGVNVNCRNGHDCRCIIAVSLAPEGLVLGTGQGLAPQSAVDQAVARVIRRLKTRKGARLARRSRDGAAARATPPFDERPEHERRSAMKVKEILVTAEDMAQLRALIEDICTSHPRDDRQMKYARKLEAELDRARVVDARDIPSTVVTMNSWVQIREIDGGQEMGFQLVYPREASFPDKVSVLAPLGTAVLGYRVGDTFEWEVPAGRKRFQILSIAGQPEAAQHGRPAMK